MLANSISCNSAGMGGDRMQFDQLKRHEFITLLGGAAVARGARAAAGLTRFEDEISMVSATTSGRCATSASAGDGRGASRGGKLQFIVRKAVWTDAILGEP
jgi:hypothetical protein